MSDILDLYRLVGAVVFSASVVICAVYIFQNKCEWCR
jgi:hypothetical protein